MKTAFAFLLLGLLALPASAQTLYVRNHPFKGKTSGAGKDLQVSLKDFATAVDLPVKQTASGWLVGTPPTDASAAGVWVNGTQIAGHEEGGEELVNLEEFSKAAGLRYQPNPALGTIDVNLGTPAARSGGTARSFAASAEPGKPVELSPGHPGELIDVTSFIPPGHPTLLFCYRFGYKTEGYADIVKRIDVLAKDPHVTLLKYNVGDLSSPFEVHYKGTASVEPVLFVISNGGSFFRTYTGHAIGGPLGNPDAFLKEAAELARQHYPPSPFRG